MPYVIRYRCQYQALPIIEAALAANGYTVDIPLQRSIGGTATMVMTQGATTILLAHDSAGDLAEIEIWGIAQSIAAQFLELLPVALHKQPAPSAMPQYASSA
jgi:hypothetical protein